MIDFLEIDTVKPSSDQIASLPFSLHFSLIIFLTTEDCFEIIVGTFFLIMPAFAFAILLIDSPKYSL